ncbi:TPA: hypothetical protein KRN26_002399 [Clostridioides difficile]|uniref:hypothetical protein n=2 Tax=Clostridioides difficile TaxID=1496 RepID=UPI000939DD53|nr:hypothetical protein [Clostridioides difficile]HBE9638627.1 hypothetical protein [Clostridioides difficile]HBF9332676.1 hypothetical protein [Clostridioides difficile]HBH1920334.1 hypothetical protein [Clostridioides difficile]HCP7078771.1 hypothetical protein [Clostridioides difficile]
MKRGEVLEIGKRKKSFSPEQRAIINNKKELPYHNFKLGGFVFCTYVKNELLFNEVNISKANISRLIYLATYLNYNTGEENLLVRYSQFKEMIPIDRKNMREILNLKDRAFRNFLADVKKCELLYESNNKFYINPKYFTKGIPNFENKEYTRIYINTSRFLFEHCTPRQHKQLSYIYQLIPYIHFESNILCLNPHETDISKIKKISLYKICQLLNISTIKQDMNKFKKELLRFYIKVEDDKYYFFKYVIVEGNNKNTDYFIINPCVIWKGKNLNLAKKTIDLCFFNCI